jgi:hypothetical protein
MVDMAHIAGLVATGEHPSPFGLADIITTTTLHVRNSIHTQVTSLTISLEATDIAI